MDKTDIHPSTDSSERSSYWQKYKFKILIAVLFITSLVTLIRYIGGVDQSTNRNNSSQTNDLKVELPSSSPTHTLAAVQDTLDTDKDALPDWLEKQIATDPQIAQCSDLVQNCGGVGDVDGAGGRQYVILVLDSSGSMNMPVGAGNRMDAAKSAVLKYTDILENTTAQVGLVVYGHKGNSSQSGMNTSCTGIETVYTPAVVNPANFEVSIQKFQPTGWTPIAAALQLAQKVLADIPDATSKNSAIILITDGEETCGGNPVAIAQQIKQSGLQVVVDVVALGTTDAENQRLREIADAGGGIFMSVQDNPDAYADLWSSYFKEVTQKESRIAVCSAHTNVDISNCQSENLQKVYDYLNTIPAGNTQEREIILNFNSQKTDIVDQFSEYIGSLQKIINDNAKKAREDAENVKQKLDN